MFQFIELLKSQQGLDSGQDELGRKQFAHFMKKNQTRAFFVSLRSDYSGLGGDIDVDNDCHP